MKTLNDHERGVYEAKVMLNSYQAYRNKRLLNEDTFFDPYTSIVVKDFQNEFQLPATGIIDYDTWTQLYRFYRYYNKQIACIYPASNNPYMSIYYVVQAKINSLSNKYMNISSLELTGELDDDTSSAIKQFQSIFGLPQTGEIDCLTWSMLISI